ncbi:transition state regulatory protein AbrB [Bacillus anthracis]|nr:transition state regulatory protein AbrB [Bacillus anthracis]
MVSYVHRVFCRKMTNLKIDSKLINYFFRRKRIMKSTGIVRKVDELGRVVIPIELRRTLGIAEKDALEIYVDDEKIILKKYKPNMTCQVTGEVSDGNLFLAEGKIILSKEGAEQILNELQDYIETAK